jgi:hypothetical protein
MPQLFNDLYKPFGGSTSPDRLSLPRDLKKRPGEHLGGRCSK